MAAKKVVLPLCLFFISAASISFNHAKESIFIEEADKKTDASKFIIAHSPSYVTFLPNADAIASDEISSVILLALGISPRKELDWAGLLAGDVFRRPKANVLITVEGVTKDDNFDLAGRAASYPFMKSAGATSLAGVLSTSSVTQENLASRVTTLFGGKSLTVSASGSEMLAAAGHAEGKHSHTMFWNQREERFQQSDDKVQGLDNWSSSKKEKLPKYRSLADMGDMSFSYWKRVLLSNSVKFSPSTKEFTVSVPDKGNAVFNMDKKEDFLLFAEVDAILQILENLNSDVKLVQDGVPDIFSLSFSSVKALRRRYGDTSLQAEGAVRFLQDMIPTIVKKFTDLYNGNVLVGVLSLEWQGDLQTKYPQEMQGVFQVIRPYLSAQSVDTFHDGLPSVSLKDDLEDSVKESLCNSLQNRLLSVQSPLRVTCGGKHRERRAAPVTQSLTGEPPDLSKRNLATKYTEDYPVIFNIWLWLVIIIALSLYVVCLIMWYMDPGSDSIIYRMTSQRIKAD
ncbi:ATPase H(+)-transporting accessory protein 2 [Acropora cervicornis]|uniref:ATPase H(+)-transporting accessory protein 2 n=1 Tax=Acropora cervicornis TaxID=6130 RepID=A0AAD9R5N4_ACRCE|nr:ATPase H(+)-transporting accessory protein 2 [Acropora cervicornis]